MNIGSFSTNEEPCRYNPFLSFHPPAFSLSLEVQNSNSTKNSYFEVSFGFQNISNGFLDLNKSQLRKIYLFPMVSKSPLRNPLEMFWKPKESSNCGKVCKNEEKMETFTNIASWMTVDPNFDIFLKTLLIQYFRSWKYHVGRCWTWDHQILQSCQIWKGISYIIIYN